MMAASQPPASQPPASQPPASQPTATSRPRGRAAAVALAAGSALLLIWALIWGFSVIEMVPEHWLQAPDASGVSQEQVNYRTERLAGLILPGATLVLSLAGLAISASALIRRRRVPWLLVVGMLATGLVLAPLGVPLAYLIGPPHTY